jgi:hypothetical protein
LYRLVNRGDFKVAGSWRFQREDLDVSIAEQKEAAASKLADEG